ncbi:DeoR/GlpR transcriptional regulator [Nakamurella sp. DB0629]|uniref:DeoR/GlpR transcriptional regulator n=1 Tax=Nakamurella aerolata TaxID=1656892 RepID=A0A849A6L8_9ACTN|nr:DeoR/GlpR transcriptional regulator [Nakamurella aerolata]
MTEVGGGGQATKALQRQQQIRDRVHTFGSVTIDELVGLLGVSRMTVHRDLDALASEGVLRRIRGGATAHGSSLLESDFPYRLTAAVPAKEAIGRAAAALVEPGQAVICDESTTTLAAVRQLPSGDGLTVITNCFPTM